MNSIMKSSYNALATRVSSRSNVLVSAAKNGTQFRCFAPNTLNRRSTKRLETRVNFTEKNGRTEEAASTSFKTTSLSSIAPQLLFGLALMALSAAGPAVAQDVDLTSHHLHATPALGDLGATEEFFSNIVCSSFPVIVSKLFAKR